MDVERLATDAPTLKSDAAYGTPDSLGARAAIYRFLERPVDVVGTVLDLVDIPANGHVLDVGCGPGQYLRRLAETRPDLGLVGLDLSVGMLTAARDAGNANVVNGDVQALPFRERRFHLVLAPHMLYHASDLERAAGELRRVLRHDGAALVVTNADRHQSEMLKLLGDAVGDVTGKHPGRVRTFTNRFSLENGGAVLATAFDVEGPHRWTNRLIVPEPEPVLAYLASMRAVYQALLPSGSTWDDVVAAARRRVADVVDREGAWVTATESGTFVCRPRS